MDIIQFPAYVDNNSSFEYYEIPSTLNSMSTYQTYRCLYNIRSAYRPRLVLSRIKIETLGFAIITSIIIFFFFTFVIR